MLLFLAADFIICRTDSVQSVPCCFVNGPVKELIYWTMARIIGKTSTKSKHFRRSDFFKSRTKNWRLRNTCFCFTLLQVSNYRRILEDVPPAQTLSYYPRNQNMQQSKLSVFLPGYMHFSFNYHLFFLDGRRRPGVLDANLNNWIHEFLIRHDA